MPIIEINPVKTVKVQFAVQPVEERQTIVHCTHFSRAYHSISACPGTFLVDKLSGKRYKLLTAVNIASFPNRTSISRDGYYDFTFIFEGLDKDCLVFDLIEISSDTHPFEAFDIVRNKTDVYCVTV